MTESELNEFVTRAILVGMNHGPLRDRVERIGYVALDAWRQVEIEQLKRDMRKLMR
jgi:hypothetical protein